jgi:hypothetical protein
MHRGTWVVVFAALNDVKAAFEAIQAAPVEIVLDALPGVAGAKIEITEDHAAEMGEVGDAALARGD